MTAQIQPFGALLDGISVDRVSIVGGGLTAHMLTYGATVQDLQLDGVNYPLVLGSPVLEPYLGPMTYFVSDVSAYGAK